MGLQRSTFIDAGMVSNLACHEAFEWIVTRVVCNGSRGELSVFSVLRYETGSFP